MVSPIEAMIDQACGYKPGKPGGKRWDDEVARRCLYEAADALYELGSEYWEAAALLYYGGRHARGMRSKLAFLRQLRAAASMACDYGGDAPVLLGWRQQWMTELRKRQARGA